MEKVIFLFLRRMRVPLLMLIVSYAISITGLVLIPGVDDQGNRWHYDFFHAFYFITYVGPTIGFGEIPYPLLPAQRMWVTFTVYLTVVSWLFAIGKIFALVQDPAFSRAMTEALFIRAVRAIRDPYYIVCGYGETGKLLVRALVHRNIQCVVIESDLENISDLQLEELPMDVPSFCGDASETRHLQEAGLELDNCLGVLAITDNDDINVKIAVTSKLLCPRLNVICRAAGREAADNMESFNTNHIINPFESFAEHMGMAVRTPSIHLLHRWLVAMPGRPLDARLSPPKGLWVICGFGRFGQAMARYLAAEGIELSIIESDASRVQGSASTRTDRIVIGSGTDPEPLHEAGVEQAVGIVAGTDNDANNLSVIMTAQMMNPNIFKVARQNKRSDTRIFQAAKLDLTMEPSRVIVWRILELVTVPLLAEFLSQVRRQDDAWARTLLDRVRSMTGDVTPEIWCVCMDGREAPAVLRLDRLGLTVHMRDLVVSPIDREERLAAQALLIRRGEDLQLLPDDDEVILPGDQILWAARGGFKDRLAWLLHNPDQLEFLIDGQERPTGAVGRWFAARRRRAEA